MKRIEFKICSCGNQILGTPKKDGTKRQYFPPRCKICRYKMPKESLIDFFWNRINKTNKCWYWTGSKTMPGYGLMRGKYAHRFSYELAVGEIPKGKVVDHICCNPSCVRPDHLQILSIGENLKRHKSFQTHCIRGHLFNKINSYKNHRGHRICRVCNRERTKEYYHLFSRH